MNTQDLSTGLELLGFGLPVLFSKSTLWTVGTTVAILAAAKWFSGSR